MKTHLSPADLARALGVGVSSVKRWVDGGAIRAGRTAGGHRRISLAEAIRFARAEGSVVVEPEVLGLGGDGGARLDALPQGDEDECLYEALLEGSLERASGVLIALYLNGWSVARIVDGPLRESMHRVGRLWLEDESGIYREHLATDVATQSLSRLRSLLPTAPERALAVGGLLSGDRHLLAAVAAATVLQDEGLRSINLGADTPVESIILGAEELQADLVWLSLSTVESPPRLAGDVGRLLSALERRRVPVVVGGAQVALLETPNHERLHTGSDMAALSTLIRELDLGGKSSRATPAR